jgi:hypothetical protein
VIVEQVGNLPAAVGASNLHILLRVLCEAWPLDDSPIWKEAIFDSLRRLLLHVDIRRSEEVLVSLAQRLIAKERFELGLRLVSETFLGLTARGQERMAALLQSVMAQEGSQARLGMARQLPELCRLAPPAPEQLLLEAYQWCMGDPD